MNKRHHRRIYRRFIIREQLTGYGSAIDQEIPYSDQYTQFMVTERNCKPATAKSNLYQIEGRYPGDREVLYQQTSVDEFNDIFKRTGVELEWLKQKLKSEQ